MKTTLAVHLFGQASESKKSIGKSSYPKDRFQLLIFILVLMLQLTIQYVFGQKLLDPATSGGPISIVTASSGGSNTSVALAYSIRQLKTTYDHAAITPPTAVGGFTNSPTPLVRVRRSTDDAQLDIGYDGNGNLDTVTLKNFVSNNSANPTASGYISVFYDQSGNNRDGIQNIIVSQPRIVNAGAVEVNGNGVPGIVTDNGSYINDGGSATDFPNGVNRYGIDSNRTLNAVCQPRTWVNAGITAGNGTYIIDRNVNTGGAGSNAQERPITSFKATSDRWSLQIRDTAYNINSSITGSVPISAIRSDNVTVIRSGNSYPLYVNAILSATATLAGYNPMSPVKLGYGQNNGENIYYGECLLFPSALSNADYIALNTSQDIYYRLGSYPIWTGATSNDWNTATNWNTNDIPTNQSIVIIPSGTPNSLYITAAQTTLAAKRLTIVTGAAVTIDGNLNVSDSATINGTITGTGSVTFSGSFKQFITGTSPVTFNSLGLNNTTDTLVLTTNLVVKGSFITATNSKINMGTNTFSGTLSTIVNNGSLITSNTSATPIPLGKTWGGRVVYNAASGGQTVADGTYNNLILTNTSGTNIASAGTIFVNGTFFSSSGGTFDLGTASVLHGTLATVSNNGTIKTSNLSATPLGLGITWGGTGSVIFASLTGGQTLGHGTYTNLVFANTSGTNTGYNGGTNVTITGSFTTTAGGTVNMANIRLQGSGTFTNNGTIVTKNTSSTPLPAGLTWGGTIRYDSSTGGQTIVNGTYNNLTLGNTSGTSTMNGATIVNGILSFSGGNLGIGSNTLNIHGTISGMSATASLSSNGSSNLLIGGSGTLGASIYMDQTTPGTTNRLNNLTYNRASQTITLGNAMQVAGVVSPIAGSLATGNMLTLISNDLGTASIATGLGEYISGNVIAERHIPGVARRWRFLASPVAGTTIADWQNEIYVTGAGGATNGFDATTSNQAGFYSYNETLPGDYNTNGWTAASNTADPLTTGKGFRVFVRGDRSDPGVLNGNTGTQAAVTMNAIGAVNTGDITMPVSFTSSGNIANDGWNLMGNPYPSAIDWNAFHDAGRTGISPDFSGTNYAHLGAVVTVYNANTNGYSSYNAISNTGIGVMINGIIPSGAAFWVKTSGTAPSMILRETHKIAATPAAMFKQTPQSTFTLRLVKDAITADEMIVKYIPEADKDDDLFDIPKLYGEVNIASITENGKHLSGNCKPFNGISDSIRLSIGVGETGSYTFDISNVNQLSGDLPVYLTDAYTHKTIDLHTQTSYVFNIDKAIAATSGNDRFMIVVNPMAAPTTGTEEQQQVSSMKLYPSLTEGLVTVTHASTINKDAVITITDAAGKKTEQLLNNQSGINELNLDLSAYPNGAYFISVSGTPTVFKCVKMSR